MEMKMRLLCTKPLHPSIHSKNIVYLRPLTETLKTKVPSLSSPCFVFVGSARKKLAEIDISIFFSGDFKAVAVMSTVFASRT